MSLWGAALVAYLIADYFFEIIARVVVGNDSLLHATTETAYYAAVQPVGTLMLLAPFAALGLVASSIANRKSNRAGIVVLSVGILVLGFMYLIGHIDSERFMAEKKWTAATLSVGLLPYKTIFVVFVLLVLGQFVPDRRDGA